MNAAAIEAKLREFLSRNAEGEGIAAAYLFGSVARGTAAPGSDVDVGVLYEEDPPLTLEGLGLRLEGDLESLLGKPVQVVVLNEAVPELIVRIIREGRLLLDHDRSKRAQFEVASQNEFWDFEPNLRLYRDRNGIPDPSLEDLIQRYRQTRQERL